LVSKLVDALVSIRQLERRNGIGLPHFLSHRSFVFGFDVNGILHNSYDHSRSSNRDTAQRDQDSHCNPGKAI
jgi:hypothetical protein